MQHRFRRPLQVFLVLALATILAGCGGVRQQLGLVRNAPDEFTVVRKAPLVIPPDFNLRPPQPGALGPQEPDSSSRAQAALLGGDVRPGQATGSRGEQALLANVGASGAAPNIREVLQAENSLSQRDENFVQRLMFWRADEQGRDVVNPSQETRRLQQQASASNTGAGDQKPATIRRKGRSLLNVF
jgi:hypothetical protein